MSRKNQLVRAGIRGARQALRQFLRCTPGDAQRDLAAIAIQEHQQDVARVLVIIALDEAHELDEREGIVNRDRTGCRIVPRRRGGYTP